MVGMAKRLFGRKSGKRKTSGGSVDLAAPAEGSSYRDHFSSYVKAVIASPGEATTETASQDAEEATIQRFHTLLAGRGLDILEPSQLRGILRSEYAQNDPNKAYELLCILADSIEGRIHDFSHETPLQGAVNRGGVSCYLDSLLFAMFLRLDCFQAILYNSFPDETRNHLVILLRLWVNLLRLGKLITPDITRKLQNLIAEAGWPDAAELRQQDASELFTFLTDKLELPLLTLKVDLYHTGRDDANDDHKFVNERLLEIPIPPDRADGGVITLEDCLESYFNNHVEVKRYLQRQNSELSKAKLETKLDTKIAVTHVESVDASTSNPSSPSASPRMTPLPGSPAAPHPAKREGTPSSIIQKRWIPEDDVEEHRKNHEQPPAGPAPGPKTRKGSLRHEVMMPALQVFGLIPWYADNLSSDDAQTAIHFSQKRPILGMCLKRYDIRDGRPVRRSTYVDIPVEIGLPHFIKDDHMDESAPIFGNFKLVLQAVVCHRGTSTDSGHYVSLVRGKSRPDYADSVTNSPPASSDGYGKDPSPWLRFDDLANNRVTEIDIEQALREESPYMLFYQILPIDCPPDHDSDDMPPGYDGHVFELDEKTAALGIPSSVPTTPRAVSESRLGTSGESYEICGRHPGVNDMIRKSAEFRSREDLEKETADGTRKSEDKAREQTSRQGSNFSVNASRAISMSRQQLETQQGEGETRRSGSFFRFGKSAQRQSNSVAHDSAGSNQNLAPPTQSRHHRGSSDQLEQDGRGRSNHSRNKSIQKEREKEKEKEKEKKEKKKHKLKKPDRECVVM